MIDRIREHASQEAMGWLVLLVVTIATVGFLAEAGAQNQGPPDGININGNHRVIQFDGTDGYVGDYVGEWSVPMGKDESIGGMAVSPGGDVYININGNHRVLKCEEGADECEAFFEIDMEVYGDMVMGEMAVDDNGQVYININGNHRTVERTISPGFPEG
jgi:hypothetical protein